MQNTAAIGFNIMENMTPFLKAVQQVKSNKEKSWWLETSGKIDHFEIQLSNHHFNLKLMAKGLKFKGVKFKDLKKYYGLKGRTAADCLKQFEQIKNEYLNA